ncbi:MAG: hypothetical protein Q7S26_01185 [bacterium]|nr:hypothetical protein [bacterium]
MDAPQTPTPTAPPAPQSSVPIPPAIPTKTHWPLIIVMTVVGLIIVGGGIYFYVQTNSQTTLIDFFHSPNATSTTPTTSTTTTPVTVTNTTLQYLTFQLFTYAAPLSAAGHDTPTPLDKKSLEKIIDDKVKNLGRGDGTARQLGFIIGPLTLNHTDEELRGQIRSMFEIAEAKNVAVGFHIDDSMFWQNRGLTKDKKNIEWLDWQGTPNTGRELSWGARAKIAPQMCFNSTAVVSEVSRVARDVIGAEIKKGVDRLKTSGKEHLFAGVIAGWETQIGPDFETKKPLGYCALTNRGFSATHPPADIDRERELIVQEFIELWTKSLMDAGVPKEKIYSHVGAPPRKLYDMLKTQGVSFGFSEFAHFAPVPSAFGKYHSPGFSIYDRRVPQEIYDELTKNGNPAWALAEGISGNPSPDPKEQGGWEGWLAGLFNHGATVVNVFPVGTDSVAATTAFKKFLLGEKLVETAR